MSGRSTAWKAAMAASIATISVLLLAGYWENKRRKHLKQKMKDRKESSIDIGGEYTSVWWRWRNGQWLCEIKYSFLIGPLSITTQEYLAWMLVAH